jgi:preprotein translocase subunit SecA
MTGTAETEAEEVREDLQARRHVVPPNRPLARKEEPDSVYRTEKGKSSRRS